MAILVPCLVTLREEFNTLSPGRDKSTDGWIGDTSHSGSSSDHNPDESGNTPYEDSDNVDEVHAIDVDKDLRKEGWSMQKCVDIIVARHKSGEDHRLQNIIYNRKIWSRSWGWTSDSYSGSNSHEQHAHFSARYETSNESDTSPWGLLEDDDVVTDADIEKIAHKVWQVKPWGSEQPPSAGVAEQRTYNNVYSLISAVDELLAIAESQGANVQQARQDLQHARQKMAPQ